MFVDSVTVKIRAGKGGNGVVAWRREKFIPKGGPSGGNGGKGGSIILKADTHISSLESFRNRKIIAADDGQPGAGAFKQGKNGQDLVLKIPCGTLVKNAHTGEILHDFTTLEEEWTLCRGGKGGKGNAHFRSPTHQAPNIATPGTEGEACEVILELKLIADIGLIGMPNAGKSTLLTELTKVRVKIGAYPFTTLFPNLGYLTFSDRSRVLIADIPGIIENAHENKGLGIAFLKHVERSSALIFVIDISGDEGRDPFDDFDVLRRELEAYRSDLLDKPFLTVLNKMDTETATANSAAFREKYPFPIENLFEVSAITGEGFETLIQAMKTLRHHSHTFSISTASPTTQLSMSSQ